MSRSSSVPRTPCRQLRPGLGLLAGLLAAAPAVADPGYYLLTPYADPGVRLLDLRYWTVKAPGRSARLWPELGLRWGVDSRWTTGLLASWVGDTLQTQHLGSWNWINTLLLTQGEQDVDLALQAQLVHTTGRGRALELGPLLQTELGHTRLNLNLLLEHDWTRHDGTRLKLQAQALHRLDAGLRLGLQGFGELGRWNHWADPPSLRAGPVLRLGLSGRLQWQAAYLWGRTYGRRGDMFSSQLELPF